MPSSSAPPANTPGRVSIISSSPPTLDLDAPDGGLASQLARGPTRPLAQQHAVPLLVAERRDVPEHLADEAGRALDSLALPAVEVEPPARARQSAAWRTCRASVSRLGSRAVPRSAASYSSPRRSRQVRGADDPRVADSVQPERLLDLLGLRKLVGEDDDSPARASRADDDGQEAAPAADDEDRVALADLHQLGEQAGARILGVFAVDGMVGQPDLEGASLDLDRLRDAADARGLAVPDLGRAAPAEPRRRLLPRLLVSGTVGRLLVAQPHLLRSARIRGGVQSAGLSTLPSARVPPPTFAIFERWTSSKTGRRSMPKEMAVP